LISFNLNESVLRDIDTKYMVLQGEVDQLRVRRAHNREHGNVPWQVGVLVTILLPDAIETHKLAGMQ
jgi:hypothetical protein